MRGTSAGFERETRLSSRSVGAVMRPGGLSDRSVNWVIEHLSNTSALALGVLLYPGLGLVVPLSLGLSTYYLVLCNLVGVVLALVVVLAWTGVIFDAAERRHLVDWTTELRHLNSTEFQWLVGEVFRREGWTVQETGSSDGPDGNIDLVLTKPGTKAIVQCKRWEARPVGVDVIRTFLGTLLREHLPAESGIFVTLLPLRRQHGQMPRRQALSSLMVRHCISGS